MEPVPNRSEVLTPPGESGRMAKRWWAWFTIVWQALFGPQAAHAFYAGPSSGTATAAPTFRLMVALDGPATAFSGTITTAKLTAGGANGSMTFVNGFLTAQVQAT